MSKKFTSFLVLAAALLLTVPAQAQLTKKQTKAGTQLATFKAGPQKGIDLKKAQAARKKAESQVEGLAFTGKAFDLLASLEKVQEDKAALEKQMEENLRQVKYGKTASLRSAGTIVSDKGTFNPRSITFNAGKSSATRRANRAEVVDAHGIITSPAEGESKFYARAGKEYYVYNQQLYVGDQEGMTEMVECTDGTIYIKDFVSSVNSGTWVKGTKSGNTITIPAKQVVWYGSSYGIYLAKATYVDGTGWSEVDGDFTLTIDGNTITLNGTDSNNPVAGFWTDDFAFAGYGNYETVFTYDPTYEPPTLVVLPDGAVVETWYQEQTDKGGSGDTDGLTKVAFVGNDVYLSGLFKNFPDSWIKGTISGTTVTFSGLQFLGAYGSYNIFATGSNGYTSSAVLQDFQMTYDADAKKFTSVNSLLANAAEDRVYYLEAYEDIVISKEPFAEPEATTGANVDALPYSNALATEAQFADFGVIDSNKDGFTWTFNASYGTYYSYNSESTTTAANDWLISPAIKLEAGKKYHFAIDAASASTAYAETFEVKIGTEPKASALTQSIIAATDVTSKEFVTYENEMVSVSTTGYYHFGIHCISEANMWRLMVQNFLVEAGVEPGAPAAVSDFALTQTEGKLEVNVKFTAPSKTAGGDNLASITKVDILRNGQVVKSLTDVTPGSEKTYVDNEGLAIGTYTYQVIPYNEVGIGAKSEEKSIFLSVALDVPHTFDFSQNLLDQFTVIDNNNDGKTWLWSASAGAYYGYSTANDADDYLITLPFNLKAGKTYNVIVNAKNTGYTEKFEVKAGKEATVAGLTQTVIAETTIDDAEGEWADYEGLFTATEDGQYFFAVHATSPADQYNLCVSSLTVEASAEPTAPAAVTDLKAEAGAQGALEATLTFTVPTKLVNGSVDDGLMNVKIYRDNELTKTLENLAPGSSQSWKDTNFEEAGKHTYYVVASNASGDGLKSDKVSVFVGVDQIGTVENIKVTGTTASTISLSWDEATGVNGGYVNTANVKYTAVTMHIETYWFFQYLVVDGIIGTVTGQTSGTFDYAADEGDQDYKYFGVAAYTDDADAPAVEDQFAGGYTYWLVGAPYALPFIENFAGGTTAYSTWNLTSDTDYCTGVFTNDASDEDGTAIMFTTIEDPGNVQLESGKISLANAANPTLIFDAKGAGIITATVYGSKDDGNWQAIASVNISDQYQTFKVPLKDANGQRFIRFAIGAKINNPAIYQGTDPQTYEDIYEYNDLLYVDNIKVMDLYQYNLKAEIEATPTTVVAGKTVKVVATITNEGENPVKDYTVTVKAGEKVLTTVLGSEELAPFAKDVISVDYETSVFDEAGDVTLSATVEYENDLNPDDNTATTIIKVTEPTAPAPASLTATDKGNDGVDLAWTIPATSRAAEAPVTEGYDDETVYEPFSIGGITETQHTGAIGDWTLYDGNGVKVYAFSNWDYPNANTVQAWAVFNPGQVSEQTATNFPPHSGTQFMWSICPVDASATEHWLISPVLSGAAQTISFYARAITADYGAETFEVWASSTDNQVASFTKVDSYNTDATEWAEFTAALPAGTKYFAIRHTSVDVFGLLIDDVTFTPAPNLPVAYNIYYEGTKIASVEGDKTTYTVPYDKMTKGTRTFGVSAVYANGSESKPATSTIEVTTGINKVAADGKPVDVYTVDGRLVRSQAKSLEGLKGLYIINGKKVIIK